MVLNFCGNKYDAELIANSLQLHFPAWTPGRDVRRGGTPGSSSSSSVFGRSAKGKLRGKKPKLSEKQHRELRRMYDTGDYSISDLADVFAVSRPTIYRTLQRTESAN